MSRSESRRPSGQAVALRYGDLNTAPIVIASGMGYMAEKIVEVAADSGVPVYEDNSLATMLSQLQLGQEIPPSLYQAVVEIYLYFLEFDVTDPEKYRRRKAEAAAQAAYVQEAEEQTAAPAAGSETIDRADEDDDYRDYVYEEVKP